MGHPVFLFHSQEHTHLELLQVPLELPLGVERSEGDVVVGERRGQDVQHVSPRREHQSLRFGVVRPDLDLMILSGFLNLLLSVPSLSVFI